MTVNAQKNLRVLRDRWAGCTKCSLSRLRGDAHIVFGAGSYNADFLVLSEGPTEDDVHHNLLMSGEEGQLVEDMLERAGIDPRRNVFFTSLVACRPYVVIPATEDTPERTQGRGPDRTEIEACNPRVNEILYQVDPRIIIAMGDEAWKSLVDTKQRRVHKSIATAAGELFETALPGRIRPVRYPVLAVLAPKQLVANPSVAAHGPIATTIDAFARAAKYVASIKKEDVKT